VAGAWRTAPTTFSTKRDADAFLSTTRADLERGRWVDPSAGRVSLRQYATVWLDQKPNLRPRTREQYEINLRLHILDALGDTELARVTPGMVRSWHADLLRKGKPGPPTVAKCYRLLHAMFATAVADELIPKNPCVIKGASTDRAAERPVASVAQVTALADAMAPRFRLMVFLATFTTLRYGELRALRRHHVNLVHRTIDVVEQYQELSDGSLVLGPPKTDAGRRSVAIPAALVEEVERHLQVHAQAGTTGLVFVSREGKPFSSSSFNRSWRSAREAVGLEGFHFHDLRHTGNTLAASTGASTKELMSRMGHSSPRAALIYQHATDDREQAIADALSELIGSADRGGATVRMLRPR
jgi:integrase